jgi:hypothetical protein
VKFPLVTSHEPLFKVRPLVMGNIRFEPPEDYNREIVDDVEATIARYFDAVGILVAPPSLEVDPNALGNLRLALHPPLPGVIRVYPPIEPVTTFSVVNFFSGAHGGREYHRYMPRYATLGNEPGGQLDREREKCLDRRVAWTVFYRRVAYDEPGLDGIFGTADDVTTDPLVYELIIVITRRTTSNHRYPRQDVRGNDTQAFEQPQAHVPGGPPELDDALVGSDRLAPMPWLVTFVSNQNDALPLRDPDNEYVVLPDGDRVLVADFADPPTLTFRCTPQVGVLLPVGSVFIPAVNDHFRRDPDTGMVLPRQSGFVPHAPHTVPIYEVVEVQEGRDVDESWGIIVKNNGYYPWVADPGDPTYPRYWPVWVIPPAFVERDRNGQPVFEDRSPILSVVRRVVTLHEVAP